MKKEINDLLLKMQSGENCIGDTTNQLLDLFIQNKPLPTAAESKKAMLNRKCAFVNNMDQFSSRKNAYKKGWQDCYSWIILKQRLQK